MYQWKSARGGLNQSPGFVCRDRFISGCSNFPGLVTSLAGINKNSFQFFLFFFPLVWKDYISNLCAALGKQFQILVLINIT